MRIMKILILLLTVACLCGCAFTTVEQMYCLPKRSEEYSNLQSVIDAQMGGLSYCAPLTGENQQTVQMADLTGDGEDEYLVFAKGNSEKPLQVLIFGKSEETYICLERLSFSGFAFDQVEYVRMDANGGYELVISSQLSDQLLKNVNIFTFGGGSASQLLSENCTKFIASDLDQDSFAEILLLHPGQTDTDRGTAVLYGVENGVIQRSNEVNMSEPVSALKRVITGKLHGGTPAVYVASAVGEGAIITDVYAVVDGVFTNVTFSNESGTSVQTLRNYYVYADDIDNDGVVELPSLISMPPMSADAPEQQQYFIRWYAMASDGSEVDKIFTFHNFAEGWYLQVDRTLASSVTVLQRPDGIDFYLLRGEEEPRPMMTVYTFTGQDREDQAVAQNRFILYRGDQAIFSGELYAASGECGMTIDRLTSAFRLIRQDWKTGET